MSWITDYTVYVLCVCLVVEVSYSIVGICTMSLGAVHIWCGGGGSEKISDFFWQGWCFYLNTKWNQDLTFWHFLQTKADSANTNSQKLRAARMGASQPALFDISAVWAAKGKLVFLLTFPYLLDWSKMLSYSKGVDLGCAFVLDRNCTDEISREEYVFLPWNVILTFIPKGFDIFWRNLLIVWIDKSHFLCGYPSE